MNIISFSVLYKTLVILLISKQKQERYVFSLLSLF
jgi:hypothetical protein